MGRRRKEDVLVADLAQLGGLVMLVSLVFPKTRQVLAGLGVLMLSLLGIGVLILVAVIIYAITKSRFQKIVLIPTQVSLKATTATWLDHGQKALKKAPPKQNL